MTVLKNPLSVCLCYNVTDEFDLRQVMVKQPNVALLAD